MQDRRYRPGDVLDDYCPRERRITDHAIVAMIEDEIRRTRCGSCDAEHEYKEAKVPSPRRKTQPPALFTQVLEGINGPTPPHPVASASALEPEEPRQDSTVEPDEPQLDQPAEPTPIEVPALAAAVGDTDGDADADAPTEEDDSREGGFRRSLIRATFPRPDGQAPTPRSAPEFTIQSLNNRRNGGGGQRHAGGAQNKFRGGRRRPAGGGSQDHLGPMRFRDHGSQTNNNGQGGGQGQGQGGGRRRRGGKKNR
jgi:translation initiation factor IF-2